MGRFFKRRIHSVSALCSSPTWNRPRWPDGRLVHPGEDRYYWIARLVVLPLGVAQFWLIGRLHITGAPIELGVVAAFAAVAAVACEIVSIRRIWELRDRATDNGSAGCRALISRLVATPRWPDGRLINRGEDNVASTTRHISVLLLLVSAGCLGGAGIPDIYLDSDLSTLPAIMTGPICLCVYWIAKRGNAIPNKAPVS